MSQPKSITKLITRGCNVLRDHFFQCVAVLVALAIIVVLALWLVVNLWMPASDHLRVIRPISATGIGHTIEASFPSRILANGNPVTATLTVLDFSQPLELITVTVSLSTSLLSASPGQKLITHTFSSQTPPSFSIPLLNVRALDGWGRTEKVILSARTSFNPGVSSTGEMTVFVEGEWRANLRNFSNSTVSERSPLVLLTVALASIFGGVLARHYQGLREQREEEKEQREKEQQEGTKARQLVDEIRSAIVKQDLATVELHFQTLQSTGLSRYITAEFLRIQELIKVQKSDSLPAKDLRALLERNMSWPNECAGAFLSGYDKYLQIDPLALRYTRPIFLHQELTSELKGRLEKISQREGDVQSHAWPRSLPVAVPQPKSSHPLIVARLKGLDPFAYLRAEDEESGLFQKEKGFFWGAHPIHREIKQHNSPCLIQGARGSGRSALALALGKYSDVSDHLSLYQSRAFTASALQLSAARKLFDYLKDHPTLLSQFSPEELRLLARLLAEALGQDYVRARLAEQQRLLPNAGWLSEAGDDQEKKKFWIDSAIGCLKLLDADLALLGAAENKKIFSPREFSQCVRAFGLSGVKLILDLDQRVDVKYVQDVLFPEVSDWGEDGIISLVFIPDELAEKTNWRWYNVKRLQWSPDDLCAMAAHRYKAVMGKRHLLSEIFETEALDVLFNFCAQGEDGGPQKFIRFWQVLLNYLSENSNTVGVREISAAIDLYAEQVQ